MYSVDKEAHLNNHGCSGDRGCRMELKEVAVGTSTLHQVLQVLLHVNMSEVGS